jgi:hypothetical protein
MIRLKSKLVLAPINLAWQTEWKSIEIRRRTTRRQANVSRLCTKQVINGGGGGRGNDATVLVVVKVGCGLRSNQLVGMSDLW